MAWISSKLASVNTPLGSKRTFSKNSKLDVPMALKVVDFPNSLNGPPTTNLVAGLPPNANPRAPASSPISSVPSPKKAGTIFKPAV